MESDALNYKLTGVFLQPQRPSSAAKASWRGFCECKRHDRLTLSVCSALLGGTLDAHCLISDINAIRFLSGSRKKAIHNS
jgi:hypothetical protein